MNGDGRNQTFGLLLSCRKQCCEHTNARLLVEAVAPNPKRSLRGCAFCERFEKQKVLREACGRSEKSSVSFPRKNKTQYQQAQQLCTHRAQSCDFYRACPETPLEKCRCLTACAVGFRRRSFFNSSQRWMLGNQQKNKSEVCCPAQESMLPGCRQIPNLVTAK